MATRSFDNQLVPQGDFAMMLLHVEKQIKADGMCLAIRHSEMLVVCCEGFMVEVRDGISYSDELGVNISMEKVAILLTDGANILSVEFSSQEAQIPQAVLRAAMMANAMQQRQPEYTHSYI